MSSILKALHRLEEDKSLIGEGNVDIAHDILKRRYDDAPTGNSRKLIWGGGGLAVIFFLVVIWGYRPDPPDLLSSLPTLTTSKIPGQKIIESTPPGEVGEREIQKIVSSENQQLTKKTTDVRKPKLQFGPVAEAKRSSPLITKTPAMTVPNLEVSRIIDNPKPEARLAIVNDLPVMVATDIDGAKVIEILSDRVRFSFQGEEFEKFSQISGE